MELSKLKRSLTLRVVQRLGELLPDATLEPHTDYIRIVRGKLDGRIGVTAMSEACHTEDRSNWGAIAGGYCNLVAARVQAWETPPLATDGALNRVLPIVQRIDESADRLIDEATPTDGMKVARRPWLDGLRLEFDYAGDDISHRVFVRDVEALGATLDSLAERAADNVDRILQQLPIMPVTDSGLERRVLTVAAEGAAPAMLTTPKAHRTLLDAVSRANRSEISRILACAPRSGRLYCCSIKDKAATAAMVGRAWADFDHPEGEGVPLSPRLFMIDDEHGVRYLDVGIGPDRAADWTVHRMDYATIRTPDGWWVKKQEDKWVAWAEGDGPRIRIRFVTAGPKTPSAARQLAERVRAKHQTSAELGHGFFNGLPWAWVDTGQHDGHSTASMFVVIPEGLVVVQTEVPEGAGKSEAVALQKIIATISHNTTD